MGDVDTFIGSTFSTRKGGILTVTGKLPKVGLLPINYTVECSICSVDTELFTKQFTKSKHELKRGGCPCGCSKSARWTKEQYEVLVLRVCKVKNCTFVGFYGDWRGVDTKLTLICNFDGNTWNTTSIDMFLHEETGCPMCGRKSTGSKLRKDDQVMIESFYNSGLSRSKYTFTRNTTKVNSLGYYPFWDMRCTSCSNDMYVKAGLCTGVFTSASNRLQQAQLPCRCANTYHWTKEQREYKVFQICKEESLTFLQWCGVGYSSNKSKLDWICSSGHHCTTALCGFLSGTRCRQCNGGHVQQQAYIHLLSDGSIPYCLKYGIAGTSGLRQNSQDNKSSFSVSNIGTWEFDSIAMCKRVEQVVGSIVERPYASKWDFPDGYTETCSIRYLDSIIETYEDYGGTIIT